MSRDHDALPLPPGSDKSGLDPKIVLAAQLYREKFGTLQECVTEARKRLKEQPQDQRALNDQLEDLIPIATAMRMYDAADYLKGVVGR